MIGKCFIEASEISNVTEEEKIFALHTSLTAFFINISHYDLLLGLEFLHPLLGRLQCLPIFAY